ncbi:MAG: hypothetical protein C7B47_12690 [Sulfobacillus thermosulfidooxidans]|uniref:Uncharacterized protein n=1 Tax=Sulfobacillus thermosulfidooxidans TaxID=28034 RepID=A0A2T2WSQ9_SULTH|nr:MAG: hypothetical protein C7B47_12690 [Sulfobacillus thermosulfidooxidans]
MLAQGTITPMGICRQCALIRPGVFYVVTDHEPVVLCYLDAAEALLTEDIKDLGQPWHEWIMFYGSALEKIFELWPSWMGTLEHERHMVISDINKKMRRGRN